MKKYSDHQDSQSVAAANRKPGTGSRGAANHVSIRESSGKNPGAKRQPVVMRQALGVIQMAAPGTITHIRNSCFVAALINIFTVTKSLKNLLIHNAQNLGAGNIKILNDVLLRAVNTVDASANVSADWVKFVMLSLRNAGVVRDIASTADINEVLARTINVLTNNGANSDRGQHAGVPVSSGPIVWYPGAALVDAVADNIASIPGGDGQFATVFPNTFHINRQEDNAAPALNTFQLHPPNGAPPITYILRSAIFRNTRYVGGHFTSFIDRSNNNTEWYKSEDLGPSVERITDISDTSAYQEEGEKKKEGKIIDEPEKSDLEEEAPVSQNMLTDAISYVYERRGIAEANQDNIVPVALPGDIAATYAAKFEEDKKAKAKDKAKKLSSITGTTSKGGIDKSQEDLDLQEAIANSLRDTSDLFALPPIRVHPDNFREARRQLQLQLEGLRSMSIKQWLQNFILNRLKTPDQLVGGFSTETGTKITGTIKKELYKNEDLAEMVMDTIVERLQHLLDTTELEKSDSVFLQELIQTAGEAKKKQENIFLEFESLRGLANLGKIARAKLKGGIGRQSGEGDEKSFRSQHEADLLKLDLSSKETFAVLHNPDQCAGGYMEIMHQDEEIRKLNTARKRYLEAKALSDQANSDASAAQNWAPKKKKDTTGGGIQDETVEIKSKKGGKSTIMNQSLFNFFSKKDEMSPSDEAEKKRRIDVKNAAARNKKVVLVAAEKEYQELLKRHFGDSAVNSLLGETWMEELKGGKTRVELMFEYALKQDPSTWESQTMDVDMTVESIEKERKRQRHKKDKTIAKKKKQLHNLKNKPQRRKRKRVKKAEGPEKRIKRGKSRQVSLQELFYRQKRSKEAKSKHMLTDEDLDKKQVSDISGDEHENTDIESGDEYSQEESSSQFDEDMFEVEQNQQSDDDLSGEDELNDSNLDFEEENESQHQ